MQKLPEPAYYPKLELADGSVEALKWLALVLMTIDHINHFIFKMQIPVMSDLGRLAMPLFGFVLAYNLAIVYEQASDNKGNYAKHVVVFATFFY
jgi:hypothetical protein